MVHHLLLYGPLQPMRAAHYKDATRGRFSLGNVGFEWLAPSAVLFISCWGVMFLLHVPPLYQFFVLGNPLTLPVFTFSLFHHALHPPPILIGRLHPINPRVP